MRNLGPLDPESDPAPLVPAVFERACAGLAAAELRPELDREQLPAPRRLASFSYAGSVAVLGGTGAEDEELGSGRFVLLYEPDGHPEWKGVFRCVTLIQVDLETEIAEDRLLPEVAWSWLTEAFERRQARYAALGGTVSQCASTRFGELARDRPGRRGARRGAGGTALSGGLGGMPGGGGPTGPGPAAGSQPAGAGGDRAANDRFGDPGAGDLTGVVEPIEHSLELRASWTPVLQSRARAAGPRRRRTRTRRAGALPGVVRPALRGGRAAAGARRGRLLVPRRAAALSRSRRRGRSPEAAVTQPLRSPRARVTLPTSRPGLCGRPISTEPSR